jgi:hypothetical protein
MVRLKRYVCDLFLPNWPTHCHFSPSFPIGVAFYRCHNDTLHFSKHLWEFSSISGEWRPQSSVAETRFVRLRKIASNWQDTEQQPCTTAGKKESWKVTCWAIKSWRNWWKENWLWWGEGFDSSKFSKGFWEEELKKRGFRWFFDIF